MEEAGSDSELCNSWSIAVSGSPSNVGSVIYNHCNWQCITDPTYEGNLRKLHQVQVGDTFSLMKAMAEKMGLQVPPS